MNQQDLALSASVTISGNIAHVVLGEIDLTLQVQHLDPLIRTLEGCRLIAQSTGLNPSSMGAGNLMMVPEHHETSAVGQAPIPLSSPSLLVNGVSSRPKRRSRKRVGDALVVWMRQNPGWHHEQELLDAVIHHEMTDASPKRALKIALGKQRGELFLSDAQGHWKLLEETSQGSPSEPGEATKKTSAIPNRAQSFSSAEIEELPGDNRLAQVDRVRDGSTMIPSMPQSHLTESTSSPSSVVRRKKARDGTMAGLSSLDPKVEDELPKLSSDASVDDWNHSFSPGDVDRARRNLLGNGQSAGTPPQRRGSLPEA